LLRETQQRSGPDTQKVRRENRKSHGERQKEEKEREGGKKEKENRERERERERDKKKRDTFMNERFSRSSECAFGR